MAERRFFPSAPPGPPVYGAPPQHYPPQVPPQHYPSQVPPHLSASQMQAPGSNRGRARISVRQGPGQGAVAELADVTVIGNHPQQATLVLADPYLGPRHVEILRQPDGFYARDLGTQTGTSCRGQRLGPQPFKLHNGDVLMLGQNVALLFEAAP